MDDTPADIRRRLVEGWRAMSPIRKAALVDAWSSDCRTLTIAGLRERHPLATHDELRMRLGALLLGATARQVFGETKSTMDLDLAVDLASHQVDPLVAALGADWYVSRDAALGTDSEARSRSASGRTS